MKKRILIAGGNLFCVVALIIFLCVKNNSKNNEQGQESNNFKIVTSFYPIYIIAENVTEGASNIELENMAELNGGCLHNYTLSTSDVKKVEDADVFIENGVGLENFTEKLLQIYSNVKIIDSSREIQDIIKNDEEQNGHIWTSLENYKKQVENIAYELSNYNTENAEIYRKNASQYIEKIEELENSYKEELNNISGEKVICLNEAFEYLGQELQMEMTTIETNHEESTMSAEMMSSIIEKMKNENIQMILVDKNDNKTMAETIANETGAKIYELDSGLKGSIEKDAYINMVKYNMEILQN